LLLESGAVAQTEQFPELHYVQACIFDSEDQIAEAILAYQKAIVKLPYDLSQFVFLSAHWKLANAYRRNAELPRALKLLDELLARLRQQYPEEHASILRTRFVRLDLLRRGGQVQQAIKFAPPLVKKIADIYGEQSAFTARALFSYGNALLRDQRYEQAQPIFERTLRALTTSLGPNSSDTIRARFNYAQVLLHLPNKQSEAFAQFEQCIQAAEVEPVSYELAAYFRSEFAQALRKGGFEARALAVLVNSFQVNHVTAMTPPASAAYQKAIEDIDRSYCEQGHGALCDQARRALTFF